MAVTANSIITPQAINNGFQSFAIGDTTTKKTLFTAGANGSILKAVAAQNTDTTLINFQLWIYDGSTSWQIGTIRIAVISGNDGAAPAVQVLNTTALPFLTLDSAGNPCLELKAGMVLQGSCLATMTTGKMLTITSIGEDL